VQQRLDEVLLVLDRGGAQELDHVVEDAQAPLVVGPGVGTVLERLGMAKRPRTLVKGQTTYQQLNKKWQKLIEDGRHGLLVCGEQAEGKGTRLED
jgi:hypothetical protein